MAPPKVTEDYYAILEVVQTASVDIITQSYRRLARKLHPDKNFGRNTTEAFQSLSRAYETLKDECKRRLYDANDYPGVRSKQEFRQRPEVQSDVTRLAQLQKSKRERATAWHPKRGTLDSTIFELRRDERRIQREIDNLASIAAAERAAQAAKNSWGTWLLSPFYTKVPETEEQIARKDIERQERRLEKDMKERKLGLVKEKLANAEKTLKAGQDQFDIATAWDDAKIQAIERKMAAAEEARQAEIRRREQERQAELCRQEEARQAEIRRQERERVARQQREVDEALRKQAAERLAAFRAAEKERARAREEEERIYNAYFGSRESSRATTSWSCLHHGWWAKVHGRMACPRCHDAWNYLLQCPGCEMRACPKCQAEIRPRGRARRARIPSPQPLYSDWYD